MIEKSREGGGDEAERGVTARGKVEAGTEGGERKNPGCCESPEG